MPAAMGIDIDADDPHHLGIELMNEGQALRPRRRRTETPEQRTARRAVIEASIFEVIPLRSLDDALEALPSAATVSVTASPAKGLAATQEITERLIAGGHRAVPHISARLVRDRTHTRALAAWLRSVELDEIFLVGGDVTEPGRYHDALSFLGDLLGTDHGLRRIGVTAYPDGHPLIEQAVLHEALPPAATVSVTASPAKGLAATQEITERLIAGGHRAVPHISARLVRDRTHTRALAAWLRATELDEIFLVGGDVTEPGRYHDALNFLGDLLETDHGLRRIGVTAYPDGHPLIEQAVLHEALHGKQMMLAEAGLEGYCSTQMCFDAPRIINWLNAERLAGMSLPVHLGISGVVDRAKLLSIGVRLGIGQSLRYLRKNRRAVARLMTAPHYDPNDLLVPLSPHMTDLDIRALHVFTFNQVAATVAWRDQNLN